MTYSGYEHHMLCLLHTLCVCARVRMCVRACSCVRACVRACVHVCVRACVRACVCASCAPCCVCAFTKGFGVKSLCTFVCILKQHRYVFYVSSFHVYVLHLDPDSHPSRHQSCQLSDIACSAQLVKYTYHVHLGVHVALKILASNRKWVRYCRDPVQQLF